ncbi:MAG: histidinol-phosphate transaminase [Gammaproteobacteria bacterium]
MTPLAPAEDPGARLVRRDVSRLPRYNAGLTADAARARSNDIRIAKLGSNENPFGASARAVEAFAAAAGTMAHYPDGGCSALKGALSGFLGVPGDRLIVGNGSENLIELACMTFLETGDRVVMADPCFGLHEIYARAMAARVAKVPYDVGFQFDVPAWQARLSAPAKIVMIANPSNPVGCWLEEGPFQDLIDSAPQDSLLLLDEAYYEFARGDRFPESLALLENRTRPWLVLRTFSKAYGLAGLRVGYGIASSAKVIEALDRVRTPFNVNAAAQAAACAALADQEHMLRCVAAIKREREYLRSALEGLRFAVAPSHANFLFFDCGQRAAALADRLLAHGVIVKAWSDPGYERYVRVTVGSRKDNEQFLNAMRLLGAGVAT